MEYANEFNVTGTVQELLFKNIQVRLKSLSNIKTLISKDNFSY